jgi:hypothetical protein
MRDPSVNDRLLARVENRIGRMEMVLTRLILHSLRRMTQKS